MKEQIHKTGEATGFLPARENKGKPITVIGTDKIVEGFDDGCLRQALNARSAPGVSEVVLNPDAHIGYGAPIGCVMASPTHIYPGPVGVDIKCSMSLLQLDVPDEVIADKRVRRALINAICERTPTGAGKGQRSVKKARRVDIETGKKAVIYGASEDVCEQLGIPVEWAKRCEDSAHVGHDGTHDALARRLQLMLDGGYAGRFPKKIEQLGSYGGGNHFGEAESVRVADTGAARLAADVFGLKDRHVAFLSHCGSRGFGHDLATNQFRVLQKKFEAWGTEFPAGDKHLCYAPLGTPEADAYIDDMSLGANFATVNHLLINALVLEAFQEVLPGTKGGLVYFISHNIAREEVIAGTKQWVHRKGATRAYPAGHFALKQTPFFDTGHPILLPGNPRDGSVVMAALAGAEKSCYSVNHGAGRQLGRKQAFRTLDQSNVDSDFDQNDIMTNCRKYPRDEAPDAYKDFNEVLDSVKKAELAHEVARLDARFVIKDASAADD
ncbi:RtcB family protein [Persicirhabdus sediminis]|uniref:tRNA-splicing ligase RtcB n=1 Tax=Persicirhabdus sediminis TaxID=454144 RepID=A0A8J7MCG9_9BACT|nr:RtcB family protein [Persicirhabdus sediminis]MBK1790817.1 RtcB family protein [Persicirhabdus sediminis]